MSKLDWAKHEIELALRRENPEAEDEGYYYAKGCYDSAYKAFASLLEDNHSGMSISLTRDILNSLILGKPLTPIEDVSEEWELCERSEREYTCYQNTRMSSLFKYVYSDGSVKYYDVDAYVCYDEGDDIPYRGGGARKIFDDLFPITMPYSPPPRSYKIITETLLTDRKNGDYDTKAYLRIITPEGKEINVHRYFGEVDGEWREIDLNEFKRREELQTKRQLLEFMQAKAEEQGGTSDGVDDRA